MKYSILHVFIFLFALSIQLNAQEEKKETTEKLLTVSVGYAWNTPIGELRDRFGSGFAISGGVDYILKSPGWIIGFEGKQIFGTQVKENVLIPILTENGNVLGENNTYAMMQLRERGSYLGFELAKILAFKQSYSGIRLGMGLGVFQHKIRIQVDSRNVPIFRGEYLKGFDRNTVGPALKQSIGYQHLGNKRRLNYSLELEMIEGFTKNVRAVNFDTQMSENQSRLDILFNVKAKWYLPIKVNENPEEIYY